MTNFKFFEERVILAATLESVEKVNEYILSQILGDQTEYLSSDSTHILDEEGCPPSCWFTIKFLNNIKSFGLPNHRLVLKKGVPIMLLRNIDPTLGPCNGTRLIVSQLGKNIIATTIVPGKDVGDNIFIPRMNLIPSDSGLPFKFQRRQFLVALCFAMTINKSQGQSLSYVVLYLSKPVFSHGQFYVVVSRVKTKSSLKVLILDDEGRPCKITSNVLYNEVF